MASTSYTSPLDPQLISFARGVIARLSVWPTLKLAVNESWGGPESAQKRTWMSSIIIDAFDPAESLDPPDDIYLEEMLLQIMSDEYDVVLEDGSAEAVAKDIVKLWAQMKDNGSSTLVDEWEEKGRRTMGEKVQVEWTVDETGETEADSTDEDDEDIDEAPELLDVGRPPNRREESEIDDEGFTLVKKGRGMRHG